jgi:putative tryptophan/tyrosine transport system substrate-binding protein
VLAFGRLVLDGQFQMRRRNFIALLGGAAVSWPLVARAQQRERMRRIGVFMPGAADDAEFAVLNAAFLQGLAELGWTVGRNVHIDYRWGAGDVDRYRVLASELVTLAPDVVLAFGYATVNALQKTTRNVPIVFAGVIDPVGGSLVESLARPGGNTTGFLSSEFGFAGKWLQLLKEIAPRITRAAVLRDSAIASQVAMFGSIQSLAPSLGVDVRPIDSREAGEIERAVAAFAREPNGGLIAAFGTGVVKHRELIVELAARHRLPAVYPYRSHVMIGGLISYAPERVDQFRLAAGYVDRILKGEKPSDLPVQAPTKYELIINLKTAKALGLDVPATLLARADEVIE